MKFYASFNYENTANSLVSDVKKATFSEGFTYKTNYIDDKYVVMFDGTEADKQKVEALGWLVHDANEDEKPTKPEDFVYVVCTSMGKVDGVFRSGIAARSRAALLNMNASDQALTYHVSPHKINEIARYPVQMKRNYIVWLDIDEWSKTIQQVDCGETYAPTKGLAISSVEDLCNHCCIVVPSMDKEIIEIAVKFSWDNAGTYDDYNDYKWLPEKHEEEK